MSTLPVTLTETITTTLPVKSGIEIGFSSGGIDKRHCTACRRFGRHRGQGAEGQTRYQPHHEKKVLELAKQYNYQPNMLARSLVTSKTFTVGIIVPDLTNPFFPALIKGIEATLWDAGYSVILADTDFDAEKEVKTVNEFLGRRVDGLIMSPIETQDYRGWIEAIKAANLPFVSLTKLRDHDADTVVAADRYGARMAVDHLLDLGRSHILYLGNAASYWANGERVSGYREALRNAGVPTEMELIRSISTGTMENAAREMKDLLSRDLRFDAVLAFDDIMAIGVKRALNEGGKKIPDDVALVGFDNIELSTLPEISLTTVDIPKYELGKVSAQLAIERIDEATATDEDEIQRPGPYKEIVLNPTLVKRASTMGGYALP